MFVDLNLHSTATASDIENVQAFGEIKSASIQAWKDVWHAKEFQKIGWISHVRPVLKLIEDV